MKEGQPFLIEQGKLIKRMGGSFTVIPREQLEKAKNKPLASESPSNPEGATLEEAREILRDRVFGPEEVDRALGTNLSNNLENVPNIPFTREQLEQAKKEGMDLILYTDKLKDGKDLTALSLVKYLGNKQSQGATPREKYPILNAFAADDWKRKENFFTTETPRSPQNQGTYWKLVSREVILNSTNQNYLDQTKTLANYIRSLYTDPNQITPNVQQALDEFEALLKNDPQFEDKVKSTDTAIWQQAAQTLANLKLTQLFRESFVELFYRLTITDRTKLDTATQLLAVMHSWTKSLGSDGYFVSAGYFGEAGASVGRDRPGGSDSSFGLSFSAGVL